MKKGCVRLLAVLFAALISMQLVGVTALAVVEEDRVASENIYNIVSSFDDPATSRLFSWTANAEFVGDDGMVLRYRRHKGPIAWSVVEAERVAELSGEVFFKAELTGLSSFAE